MTVPVSSPYSQDRVPELRLPSDKVQDHGLHEDASFDEGYCTAHGRFAGEIFTAIDNRSGISSRKPPAAVPFLDAPLFTDLRLDLPEVGPREVSELPPYACAGNLVAVYWQHLGPIESVLDKGRFTHDFEASYSRSGTFLCPDRSIWLSILNVVFALAVQTQEYIPRKDRDAKANSYFRRAWSLLRPDTVLWQPGSIELVQCLMLMNRYLHCTSNQHQAWMTAGLAVRIAQSVCCCGPETASSDGLAADGRLKQQLWASCIALDRYAPGGMSLGGMR